MKRLLVGVLLGALAIVGLPALADHVVHEPTAPVAGVDLRLYFYVNSDTRLTACDGTEIWDHDALRIEVDVPAEAYPSEHWTLKLRVEEPWPQREAQVNAKASDGVDTLLRKHPWRLQWDVQFFHQNRGPAHNPIHHEVAQNNQYLMLNHSGFWLVVAEVKGDESGRVFKDFCIFQTRP